MSNGSNVVYPKGSVFTSPFPEGNLKFKDPRTWGKNIQITLLYLFIFLFILLLIWGLSRKSSNISTTNNNKLTSLNYDSNNIPTTSSGEIIQDPSCQILDKVKENIKDASLKGLYKIRDYYILSSYNSCNAGPELQNNLISLNALKHVISQGARLLDFEIYSLKNEPIVSTSNNPDNYYLFESSNFVNFSDAFETIINNAFDASTSPTYMDPLFVHLRIKSNNNKMLENLTSIFERYVDSNYLLGPEYSYATTLCSSTITTEQKDKINQEITTLQGCKDIKASDPSYNDCYLNEINNIKVNHPDFGCDKLNITAQPLYYFQKKIILILDRSNTTALDNEKLMEFVNLTSNSLFCRLINNFTMINSHDKLELLEFNKRTVTIVTPDVGVNKPNPDIDKSKLLGIQFNANNFSQTDNYLNNTINMFNNAGHAFILKPFEMRYFPIFVTIPPENPTGYSFASRPIKTEFLSLSI